MSGWGGNGWNNFGGFGGGMRGGGNMGMGMGGRMGGNMGGMDGDMMGGHMGMGGGMNMPYGYNMNNFINRPSLNSMGRWGCGGGPISRHQTKILTLSEVQNWLEKQQPYILQSVMKTCSKVLVNKHKVPVDDLSDWFKEPEDRGKSGTILQGGVDLSNTSKNLKKDLMPGLGWTKSNTRHLHKVTTQMKLLPELKIVPPFLTVSKEADIDREKRMKLTNNVNMVQIEVNKMATSFACHVCGLEFRKKRLLRVHKKRNILQRINLHLGKV